MLRNLLQQIPQEQREETIRAAIESIGHNGTLEIGLTLSLVETLDGVDVRKALRNRLLALLQDGRVDLIIPVIAHNASLRSGLTQQAAVRLYALAGPLHEAPGKEITLPLNDIVPMRDGSLGGVKDLVRDIKDSTAAARHLLTVLRSAVSADVEAETFDRVFKAALLLLGATNTQVAVGAQLTLAKLFGVAGCISHAHNQLVWLCLQRLLAEESRPFYQGLAFNIWLRWVYCEDAELQLWFTPTYWAALQQGLQNGDSERRKQCLAILRQSVNIAATDDSAMSTICARQDGIAGTLATILLLRHFPHEDAGLYSSGHAMREQPFHTCTPQVNRCQGMC